MSAPVVVVYSTRGHITKLSKSATARAETIRRLRAKRAAETDKIRKRAMMEVIKMKVAELKVVRARIKELREANTAARAARLAAVSRPASARPARGRPSLAGRPRDARGRLLPTGRAKTPRARATSARISRKFNADKLYDAKGHAIVYGPITSRSSQRGGRKRAPSKANFRTIEEIEQAFGPVRVQTAEELAFISANVPPDPTKLRRPAPKRRVRNPTL